jgi:hypothetical protein
MNYLNLSVLYSLLLSTPILAMEDSQLLTELSTIKNLISVNPQEASRQLKQFQNNYGCSENFIAIANEYQIVKQQSIDALKPFEPNQSQHIQMVDPMVIYFHHIMVSATKPGNFPSLKRKVLASGGITLDGNKSLKEAINDYLQNNKEQLLKNVLSPDAIQQTTLEAVNFQFINAIGKKDIDAKHYPEYWNQTARSLNLTAESNHASSSYLSVSLK